MAKHFDYIAAARQAGLSDDDLAALRHRVEGEYHSELLREMHLHRICTAIARGECTLDEALHHTPDLRPPLKDLRVGG